MRVVFLMTGIAYGGAAKSLLNLLKSLLPFSDVESFVFAQYSIAKGIEEEIRKICKDLFIIPFPHIIANQYSTTALKDFNKIINHNYSKLINKINTLEPDIVHFNSTTLAHILKYLKMNNNNIKTVIHLREILNEPYNNQVAKYLCDSIRDFSDYKIAISNTEIEPFLNSQNFSILPNPIDFEEINEFSNDHLHNLRSNNYINIGMMSIFHPNKGHRTLINALNIIRSQTSIKFRGLILGGKKTKSKIKLLVKILLNKEYYYSLKKEINKLKLNNHIVILEPQYQVFEFLNFVDIYVRPSCAGDPWGRDIIEAMAMKKPIIATGNSEFFIADGVSGFLVPPNNPAVMAEKILDLINNPQKRMDFGNTGYNKIRKMCDIDNYGKEIKNIYSKLLTSAGVKC